MIPFKIQKKMKLGFPTKMTTVLKTVKMMMKEVEWMKMTPIGKWEQKDQETIIKLFLMTMIQNDSK